MGILDNSRLLEKVGNREFPGNVNSRKSLQEPMQSLFFSGTPEKKYKIFRKSWLFPGKNQIFPDKSWKSRPKFSKMADHFPPGIPDEISRESGREFPTQKKSGSGFTSKGHNPRYKSLWAWKTNPSRYEVRKLILILFKIWSFFTTQTIWFVPRDLHLYYTKACWKQCFFYLDRYPSLPHKFAAESLFFWKSWLIRDRSEMLVRGIV